MPRVIAFLGYIPVPFDFESIAGRIKLYRLLNGLSHKKMGRFVGVDGGTICAWEPGDNPQVVNMKKLNELLKALSKMNIIKYPNEGLRLCGNET